jgi:hypothetical protein
MGQAGHYREIAAAQLYGDDSGHVDENPSHMKRSQNEKATTAAADKVRRGREEAAEAEL